MNSVKTRTRLVLRVSPWVRSQSVPCVCKSAPGTLTSSGPEVLLQLRDPSQHGGVVHLELLGGGPDRAATRDRKKIANVIPVDHMVQSCTARCASKSLR